MRTHSTLLVCLALLAAAASLNGVMDTLQFHYAGSIFPTGTHTLLGAGEQWWNPQISWENHYVDYPTDQRARFWGAKDVFIWLTDAWHLAKQMMLWCIQLAVALPLLQLYKGKWWWALLALIPGYLLWGAFFTVFYGLLLVSKKQQV